MRWCGSIGGLGLGFVVMLAFACGSSEEEIPPPVPDALAEAGTDARTGTVGGGSGSEPSACVAAGGACVCFSPCGADQHDEPSLVPSCAGPSGAPGCGEMYCCVPGKSDAGTSCEIAGDRCCDPFPGDGPNFCKNGLSCCGDGTCAATCS